MPEQAFDAQDCALSVRGLTKVMGKKKILDNISFQTQKGEVFGFLGPNGAGKTTTIKIICGLLYADEGAISIDGFDTEKQFEKAIGGIGAIVENPEMYHKLTGLENLRQYARIRDGITKARIDEVVELVGLKNRIHDKVGKYSLGMRQRLGVAQAILHRPSVLILDEPTNGLDPAGIKELRDILKHLAHDEGVSVMVSSHLMSEMELMCDRVGIIVRGVMRSVQTVEEMIASASGTEVCFVLRVSDAAAALAALPEALRSAATVPDGFHLEFTLPKADADAQICAVNSAIVRGGVALYTVAHKENKRLEDVFIELTNSGGDQIA
ncbi:MAG: ABC transporter ATP-binding protein [Oscillospiraceae bacterium]